MQIIQMIPFLMLLDIAPFLIMVVAGVLLVCLWLWRND